MLEDAARALDYAHAHWVFHRDVKPSNIMIQDDGRVKIADFGIAKVAWAKTITETGMMMGSPYYMAAEQLKGEPVTGRTDQFALAGVAYTVLTGKKPFDADTVASLFNKILHQDPPPAARKEHTEERIPDSWRGEAGPRPRSEGGSAVAA